MSDRPFRPTRAEIAEQIRAVRAAQDRVDALLDATQPGETDEERADREETERAHAAGDHQYCGITCEAEFTAEKLRNGVLWRAAPGSEVMLEELLRRARAEATAPSAPAAPAERRDRYEAEASPWYEVINPRNATTSIALVHDDGDLYLPEGPDALTVEEFHFAAARGQAHRLMRVEEAVAVADTEQAELRSYVAELEQQAAARPLSRAYSHEACGFHWYGRDGMDIPLRDGQPICPRCELAQGQTAVLPADATAEVRKLVKRLVAHAKGFQDVLDDGDSEAWGKTVGADIEALQAALDGHPLRRLADEAPQPEPRLVAPAAGLQRLSADRQPDCPPGTHAPGAPCTGDGAADTEEQP